MQGRKYAGVAELADAPDLGSGVPDVQVQVLSPALNFLVKKSDEGFFFVCQLVGIRML